MFIEKLKDLIKDYVLNDENKINELISYLESLKSDFDKKIHKELIQNFYSDLLINNYNLLLIHYFL